MTHDGTAKPHCRLPASDVTLIEDRVSKLQKKFSHELFWNSGWPDDIPSYEREMSRFKNA